MVSVISYLWSSTNPNIRIIPPIAKATKTITSIEIPGTIEMEITIWKGIIYLPLSVGALKFMKTCFLVFEQK